MKKVIILMAFALSVVVVVAQNKDKVGVAPTSGTAEEGVRAAITDALIQGIIKSGFSVVERSQYDKIVKEQGLQASDFTDDNSRVEFGNLIGAKYLCVSSVNKIAQNYLINYRMVDVQTGDIIKSERKTATETNILEVINAISEEKLFVAKSDANPCFCGLEIQKEDLKGTENCSSCGQGWRLPTINELKCMYEHRKEIGNFLYGEYLSGDKSDGFSQGIRFSSGTQTNIIGRASIRCVKSIQR